MAGLACRLQTVGLLRVTARSLVVLVVVIVGVIAVQTRGSAASLVPAGGDLQAAIDRARPGDVILLEPGATYVGNFTLPPISGSRFITIRSAAEPSRFPAQGRVRPEHAAWMPTLRSPNGAPAVATRPGAQRWRLQWLAFEANAGGAGDIITLGDGSAAQRDLADVPRDLILDGLIIRGDAIRGQKRGIALNSASTIIRNSDIRGIMAVGQDSQAICGWNGPGPYLIENNYLEAAGENVMFGGADPFISDLVPGDIVLRGNYVTKPLTWRAPGTRWTVKNLFELKNAERVLVEHNVFEHNWGAAQPGYAIVLTPMNEEGRAPWTVVSDVTFRRNIVRHVAAAVNILGYDYRHPSRQTRGILIQHNLFYDVSGSRWGGDGRFLLVGDEPEDIVVDHNTIIQTGSVLHMYGSRDGRPRPIRNLRLTNNVALHNAFGIIGDGQGIGQPAINAYLLGEEIRRNAIAGANPSRYPPDNFFPSVPELLAEFVDPARGDYRLRPDSRYRRAATSGTALGAAVDLLRRRLPPGDAPGALLRRP
jgi:hypothetical protein